MHHEPLNREDFAASTDEEFADLEADNAWLTDKALEVTGEYLEKFNKVVVHVLKNNPELEPPNVGASVLGTMFRHFILAADELRMIKGASEVHYAMNLAFSEACGILSERYQANGGKPAEVQ
jgi:hypothetical protein